MIARWEVSGVHEHLLDSLIEAGEFHITGGDEDAVFEDEVQLFILLPSTAHPPWLSFTMNSSSVRADCLLSKTQEPLLFIHNV